MIATGLKPVRNMLRVKTGGVMEFQGKYKTTGHDRPKQWEDGVSSAMKRA